jgi:hypothetical protein
VDAGVTVVTLDDGKAYTAQILDDDPMAFMMVVVSFMRAHDESLLGGSRPRGGHGRPRRGIPASSLPSLHRVGLSGLTGASC